MTYKMEKEGRETKLLNSTNRAQAYEDALAITGWKIVEIQEWEKSKKPTPPKLRLIKENEDKPKPLSNKCKCCLKNKKKCGD